MRFKFLLIALVLTLFISCEKEPTSYTNRDFAFPELPIIKTNDGKTVSFSGKFDQLGEEEILEYGLVWYPVFSNPFGTYEHVYRDSIVFQGQPNKDIFEFSSNEDFCKDVTYEIRVFAKTINRIVYGSQVSFKSEGTEFNPWSFVLHNGNYGTRFLNDSPMNLLPSTSGFYLLNKSDLYRYDKPEKTFGQISNEGINEKVVSFILENNTYLIELESNKVRILDEEDKGWETRYSGGLLGYQPLGEPHGFTMENKGYLIDKGLFLKLKFNGGGLVNFVTWDELTPIDSEELVKGVMINNEKKEVIAITADNKMWKYDFGIAGAWTEIPATAPFDLVGSLAVFNLGEFAYMGFSSSNLERNFESFWRFNLMDYSWEEVSKLPLAISSIDDFTSCQSQGKGYIGTVNVQYIEGPSIWVFDSSKVK